MVCVLLICSIVCVITLALIYVDLYTCPCHCYYPKTEIEQYLNETSESIILNSENDTEKVHRIIAWENKELRLTPFIKRYQLRLRQRGVCSSPDKVHWYIYVGKAYCGERAIIFEDMAKRTNLTYRRVVIDGYIDPEKIGTDTRLYNHRWSEVWLDDDWRIADSGCNLSYPEDNQSYFTLEKGWLIGHVAILYDNGTFGDRTDSYVNRTGKLIIQAVKDGESIKDAEVSIKLTYMNHPWTVVGGNNIKRFTNDSGLCGINLGIYDDAYYMVKVNDKDIFYEYFGRENVTIANETNYLVIELDERKIQWWTTALFIGTFILAFFVIAVFRKAIRR